MSDQVVPDSDLPEGVGAPAPQASPSQLPSISGSEVPSDDMPDTSEPKLADNSAMKDFVTKNLQTNFNKPAEPGASQSQPREATSFFDALKAGLQMSSGGLLIRGRMPDVVLPEHSGRAYQIASQIGQMAGDLPAMVAGGIIGSAPAALEGATVGSLVPGVGTAIGGVGAAAVAGTASAFALPAAIRKMAMDHYEKGDITTPQEFANRLMATSWEAIKGATTGAATAITGGAVAPIAGPLAAAGSELAAMTTVGAAVEGHLPHPDDFINGAILLGGLHGVSTVAPKLRNIYAATGERPESVIEQAQKDVQLKQDLLSSDKTLPEQARPTELMHFSTAEGTIPPVEQQAEAIKEGQGKPAPIPPPEEQWKLAPKEEPTTSGGGSGGEQPPRSPEEQEILNKIGENPEAPSKTVKEQLADFYQNNIDYLSPIKTAIEKAEESGAEIPAEENAYQAGRRFAATSDLARSFIEFGTRDPETNQINGEGLEKILTESGDLNGLRAYGMAERGLELQGRGITPWKDFNAENAEKVVKENKAEFSEINQRRVDFENRVVDFTQGKGLLSEEQAARIKEANQQHFAFNRVQDPDVFTGKVKGSTILKKIYGSEREILDPIESTYKNTEMMLRKAQINDVRSLFLKNMRDGGLVDEDGTNAEAYLKKVPADMVPVDVKSEELSRALEKQGIDVKPEDITIFRPEQSYLKDNQVAIYTDGKREVYEGDPGVIAALKRLDGDPTSMDMWSKIMRGFATATRVGIVGNPTFGFSHFFRSQIMSGVYSKTGMIPFFHSAMALKDFMTKSADYQDWLYHGGASSSWFKLEDTYMKDKTFANAENPQTVAPWYGSAWNIVKKASDATESFIKLTDNLSRLAEYKRSVAQGVSPQESAFRSREVVPDYQKVGLERSMLRTSVAFIGAHVNSLDRMAQELADPTTRKGMIAKLSVLTMISAGLWAVNKDDKAIEDLPDWQKNTYWNFNISRMTGQSSGGENEKSYILRLPKPWAPGILAGSGVEVALDSYFKDRPSELKDFMRSLTQSVVPEPIPNILSPILEQASNKKMFTGSALVPEDREKALPAYQVRPYTSETAKQISKVIGAIPYVKDLGPSTDPLASPAVIENYIESWGGTLGGYALRLSDYGLSKVGVGNGQAHSMDDVSQMPLINKFVSMYPSWKSQTIEDFYNNKNEVDKILNSAKISNKEHDQVTAQQLMLAHPEIDVKLDQIGQAISTARKFLDGVRDNQSMSAEDKRQLEYTTLYQILSAAKFGNQQVEAFKKTQKNLPQ